MIAQMHKTQVGARMKLQEKVTGLKAEHAQHQVKCQKIDNVKPEIGQFQNSLQTMIKERQKKSDKENAARQKELMMKKMAILMMQLWVTLHYLIVHQELRSTSMTKI